MAKDSEKKSGGGGGAVAGIVILAFLLGGGTGLGFRTGFFGKGDGNSQNTDTPEDVPAAEIVTSIETEEETSESAVEETETQEIPINVIDITVSGSMILKDGNEITAEDIISEVNAADGFAVVNITDDSAIADTMDELREKLDSAGAVYKIQ